MKQYFVALVLVLVMSLSGSAATTYVGDGQLLDAYALADGGTITITLREGGYRIDLLTTVAFTDGSLAEDIVELPRHLDAPTEWITEICGGRLHIWLSWGRERPVLHSVWDLPLDAVQLQFLPLVCRSQ
jgi:hypothetical protein